MDVARVDSVALSEFLMVSAEEERWSGGRAGYLQRCLPLFRGLFVGNRFVWSVSLLVSLCYDVVPRLSHTPKRGG